MDCTRSDSAQLQRPGGTSVADNFRRQTTVVDILSITELSATSDHGGMLHGAAKNVHQLHLS